MRRKLNKKFIITAVLIIIIIATVELLAPHPSAAAYCKLYKEQNVALAHKNTPKDLAAAYAKLERVAPHDVKYDTSTLRKIYQKIDNDPSQAFTASLSGLTAETNVEDWVKKNCAQ